MYLIIGILAFTALFLGITALVRILAPKIGLGLFILAPLVVIAYWQAVPPKDLSIFLYLKLFSVCIAVYFIQILKITDLKYKPWALRAGYIILIINIFEAIFFDGLDGDYFNAILGILLLFSLKGGKAISVDESSAYNDVHYDLSAYWVWAYALWNFVFVYNFKEGAYVAVAFLHLGLPLMLSISNYKLFIQYRSYLLALTIFFVVTVPGGSMGLPTTPGVFVPWIAHLITAAGVVLVGWDLKARYAQE